MKKLIIVIGLVFAFQVFASEPLEAEWKTKGRNLVTQFLGSTWAIKFFGEEPKPAPEVEMPAVPKLERKSTDVDSYTKKTKEPTAFDKLPEQRKRQYDYEFLKELFLVTRKTEARDEDLATWLNTLEQGGSREGIYQALVLDEVYVALENIDEKSSDKLKAFTLQFSQKFLNQTFKEGSLDQFNLYSIKRIVTDKAIDVMANYEQKDLDSLYRWYAVFSSDIAKQNYPFLRSPLRQNESALYHYEWAKNSPIQQIKSEFIIKLHGVMNNLQVL